MRYAKALVAASVVASVAACGSHVSATQAFTTGKSTTCLVHQAHAPVKAYEGGPDGDTDVELTFLHYFTALGTKPFCDGKAANKNDQAWGQLYVRLTTNKPKVTTLLG